MGFSRWKRWWSEFVGKGEWRRWVEMLFLLLVYLSPFDVVFNSIITPFFFSFIKIRFEISFTTCLCVRVYFPSYWSEIIMWFDMFGKIIIQSPNFMFLKFWKITIWHVMIHKRYGRVFLWYGDISQLRIYKSTICN